MKTAILLCLLFISPLSACADHVRVKTHHGWMGPSTWEATDGNVSVSYYNGSCCCVAEKVLENLADQANHKELDWSLMADPKFQRDTLAAECAKVKSK